MAFNPIGLLAVSTISKKLKKADQAPFLMLGAMAGPRPTDALLPMSLAQKKVADEDVKRLRVEVDAQRAEVARVSGELAAAKQSHVAFLRELQGLTDIIDCQHKIHAQLEQLEPPAEEQAADCDELDPVVHALYRIASAISTSSSSQVPTADGVAASPADSGGSGQATVATPEPAAVPGTASGSKRRN